MKLITHCVLIVAIGMSLASPASAELPRRAPLGVALGPARPGQPSNPTDEPRVTSVVPGLAASALGVKPGDRIIEAGGRPTASIAEVIAYAQTLRAGNPVRLIVDRDGQRLTLSGQAIGRPRERYDGAGVTYGQVAFRGGQLSDILVTPDGVKDPPIVYLIQGFSCATVESVGPTDLYHPLIQAFVHAKIGVYRVEKPGLGDSTGGVDCSKIDYAAELDAFRTAYAHLAKDLAVAPERTFLLGHSLGGLEAPMLADERAPRGVAVYGTVLRNWADYHHDIDVFQEFISAGRDPVEQQARAERNREAFRLYYFEHKSPAEIAKARPDLAESLRDALAWDGANGTMGRNYKYMQDLAGLSLPEAWKKAHTNVLALYGGSDWVALNNTDHKLIADVANFYRPGSGTFIEVPNTGHGMDLIGSLDEARKQAMSGKPAPPAPFNPKVADALIGWIRACLAKPPVA